MATMTATRSDEEIQRDVHDELKWDAPVESLDRVDAEACGFEHDLPLRL